MPVDYARRDEVRKIILSLLLARPSAMPVAALDRDYYEVETERIPYRKFGYSDIVEFLRSMPEHFVIEWSNGSHYVRGIASEKSMHVSSLVSRQRNDLRSKRPRQNHRLMFTRIKIPAEQLLFLTQYVKNNPNGVSMQSALSLIQRQLPHITLSLQDIREQLRELSHQLCVEYDVIYPRTNKAVGTIQSHEVQTHSEETQSLASLYKPQSASQLPLATETIYVGGDEGSECVEDFDEIENDYIPAGCISKNHQRQLKTSDRLAANFAQYSNYEQNTTFNCNNENNDIDLDRYFTSTNNINNEEITNTELTNISSLINDRLKSRLEQLIQKHPEGILCSDLPRIYLEEYKVHLNYTDLGINSVREFVSYLPSIFFMMQMDTKVDFILYSADKRPTVPDNSEIPRSEPIDIKPTLHERHDEYNAVRTQPSDDDAPIPSEASPTITRRFAPEHVMNYDDNVDKILVTELQSNRKYLEVYIVEVFHPNFFWIHLRENKKHFEMLMDELHNFYASNQDKYAIPRIALKKGLNCACVYSNRWHRGVIKTVKPDFKVTVLFYDYGTLKTYAPEEIYYLHKQFSSLPTQAIPCGLYNVMPCVGDRWKKSVIDKFIDKIAEALLAATIISVDPEHNSMMVILTDTSEEEDVRINDWLVKEKLAQYGKMGDAVDMVSIMKYVVNNLNKLPTYCFAEESLMPDSRCKATSTEEIHEVPLASPGQTFLLHDNQQQKLLRPPPGFTPFDEQFNASNVSARNFNNNYSYSPSNAKVPVCNDAETMTNPFLNNQQFISNDVAKQAFWPIWNENLQLQIKLTGLFCDLLEHSPLGKQIFENHMTVQYHLNKILKGFKQALTLDDDKSPSSTPNLANGMLSNDVNSAQQVSFTPSNETVVKKEPTSGTSTLPKNPFGFANDDDRSQNFTTFSTHGSSSFAFKTNQNQSDEFSDRTQASQYLSTPSIFPTYGSTTNSIYPSANQSENVPSMKPLSPRLPTNVSTSDNNCDSSGFSSTNSEFKETNPFKLLITNEMQVLNTPNEGRAHDYSTNSASYFPDKNLQTNNFTVGYVNVINDQNYTPKIVYEAGPVMYNTQNKQDINAKQSDLDNIMTTFLESGQYGNKLSAQTENSIPISHTRHDSPYIDEGYVTRPPTDYMVQNSPPIISSELNYHRQEFNKDEPLLISPKVWKQIEIPERWVNPKFQNNIPLQNTENPTIGSSANLSQQYWNYDRGSVPRDMKEMMDLTYVSQFNAMDKKRMNTYVDSWVNPSYRENQISAKHATCTFYFNYFLFQKIDSIKGVTFIFNVAEEGWMLIHEFVEVFTNFRLCGDLIATLDAMNIKVAFKEIQRSEYPLQFLQLDNYPLNVPRDSNGRIISINLISLQTALRLLCKLKIVSREEIDNAFKKNNFRDGSLLPKMWVLIVTYRDLRQRIEQYLNCRM